MKKSTRHDHTEPPVNEISTHQNQILDQIQGGLVITDLKGHIKEWNRGAERITGYSREEAGGQYVGFLHPDSASQYFNEAVLEPLMERGKLNIDMELYKKTGEAIIASLSLSLLKSEDGAAEGIITYFEDITEKKRIEARMVQEIRQREASIKLSRKALLGLEIIDLMKQAAASMNEILHVDVAGVFEYLPEESCMRLRAGCGWGDDFDLQAVEIQFEDEASMDPFLEQALMLPDLQNLPNSALGAFLLRQKAASVLSAPVKSGTGVFGVLEAHSLSQRIFDQDEQFFILAIANILASAIGHNRANAKVVNNNQRLEMLRMLNEEILQIHTPDEMSSQVLPVLRKMMPCDRVSVVVYDTHADLITFRAISSSVEVNNEIGIKTGISKSIDLEALAQGKTVLIPDLLKMEDRTSHDEQLIQGGFRSLLILPLRTKDELKGSLNLSSLQPNAFSDEQIGFARHVAYSIALAIENANLFKQVHAHREHLKYLARREVDIQENERKRISRELHDEVGQSLTALKIGLELIDRELDGNRIAVHEDVHEAIGLLGKTIEKMRMLARDMRPPELDTLGLAAALEELCLEFGRRMHITVHYRVERLPVLPDPIAICCYRLIQEAFNNVTKHAAARNVWVSLKSPNSVLHLDIQDDGLGFDVNKVLANKMRGKGLGLLGMRERLDLLNGKMDIESRPGQGTLLSILIPWEEEL